MTTHFYSRKVYCWFNGDDFVSSQSSSDYSAMIDPKKYISSSLSYLRKG